ncbi:unnamed protein product [Sphagnum balticum]
MGFLDKLWDDVVAGPQPEKGLKQLRKPKLATDISVPSDGNNLLPPSSPSTWFSFRSRRNRSWEFSLCRAVSREKENVWRSVFHPGSNRQVMRRLGSDKFDNAQPNSPSVYDWLYSKDTKTEWR